MEYLMGQTCTQLELLFRKGEQLLEYSPALAPIFIVYLEFFSSWEKDENNIVTINFFLM